MADVPELIFTAHGTARLERDGETVWTSDDDDDFKDEFADEFLGDDDADDVADFLVEHDLLEADEEFDVIEESLSDLDDAEGDDDDEDDD